MVDVIDNNHVSITCCTRPVLRHCRSKHQHLAVVNHAKVAPEYDCHTICESFCDTSLSARLLLARLSSTSSNHIQTPARIVSTLGCGGDKGADCTQSTTLECHCTNTFNEDLRIPQRQRVKLFCVLFKAPHLTCLALQRLVRCSRHRLGVAHFAHSG